MEYLLGLKHMDLFISSVKVYLAAVSVHCALVKRQHMFCPQFSSLVKDPVLQQNLNLALISLMRLHFEHKAMYSLFYFSTRTVFLVAIIPANRFGWSFMYYLLHKYPWGSTQSFCLKQWCSTHLASDQLWCRASPQAVSRVWSHIIWSAELGFGSNSINCCDPWSHSNHCSSYN